MVGNTTTTLSSGYEMPYLGVGTWQLSDTEVSRAVCTAIQCGYRHVDCASLYGNEAGVGEGVRQSGVSRDKIFLTSKLWTTKMHPDDVETACRKTLADLGTDYLDLYLIHGPMAFHRGSEPFPTKEDGSLKYDFTIHPTDTWLAMEKLVNLGLVRSIGLSNFNSEQITDILRRGSIKPVTNQVECHPYLGQEKLLQFCSAHGIKLTAYSPLGSPARPWAKTGEQELLQEPELKMIGDKHGKTPAQVLIRWQIQRGVVVIPKSGNPARIKENGEVFDFELDEADMKQLASYECNGRIMSPWDSRHPHYPFNIEF